MLKPRGVARRLEVEFSQPDPHWSLCGPYLFISVSEIYKKLPSGAVHSLKVLGKWDIQNH